MAKRTFTSCNNMKIVYRLWSHTRYDEM